MAVEFPFHPVAHRYTDPVLALQTMLRNDTAGVLRRQRLLRERVFELQYSLEGPLEGEYMRQPPLLVSDKWTPASPSSSQGISSPSDMAIASTTTTTATSTTTTTTVGKSLRKHGRGGKGGSDGRKLLEAEVVSTWPRYPATGELMRDAFDIAVDLALSWHSGRVADFRNATVPECWNGKLNLTYNNGKGKCVP